jgi:TolB-like protein/Tfp pilus assembly protein PilF
MADRTELEHPGITGATAGPARRVFLSYASHDAAVVQEVCSALEGAGFPCWMAPRDVVPGMLYADGIVRAINESTILVLILSESAVASAHVGKELERASSKRHPIIALRTDPAPLTPAFEYFLSESQWIDVGAGGADAAIASLVGAVRQHLSPGATATPNPSRASHAINRSATTRRRTWVIAGIVIVFALAAAYFFADKGWLHSRNASGVPVRTGPSETVGDKSIAVLPFTDMSEKHDQEYFGDGMADEILDLLAKVPGLTIIGRTSSFQFKGKSEDLRKVGSALGAAYVVEGSVRRSGDHMRITAQLIDTRDGAHRWSQTYDRDAGDAIEVQDEIAGNIVRALQVEVASFPVRVRPKNREAYDHYLRGLHAFDRFDEDGFNAAVAEFRNALDADPAFAPAAEQLAMTLWALAQWGFVPGDKGYPEARAAAEAAITLDPRAVDAWTALGTIDLEYDCDWQAAERELTTALKILPNHPNALIGLAQQRIAVGRWADAAHLLDAAVAGDPLDASAYIIRLWAYLRSGHLAEAEAAGRRVLEISPTYAWGHSQLATVLAAEGKYDAALAELQKEHIAIARDSGLVVVYQSLHRTRDAESAFARLESERGHGDYMGVAAAYTAFGKYDQAFESLERARENRDPDLCYLKSVPGLKRLETDPRYKAFLRKLNLPD